MTKKEKKPETIVDRLDSWWPIVLRYVGLGIALYETVFEQIDRPWLLFLAAGMMGLKSIVDLQRKMNGNGGSA